MFDSEEPKRISSVEIEFESTPGKRSYGLLHLSNSLVLSVDDRRLRLDLSLDGTDNAGMVVAKFVKQWRKLNFSSFLKISFRLKTPSVRESGWNSSPEKWS
jgi:hypothetical protein